MRRIITLTLAVCLWFGTSVADFWVEALPLGNGHLSAMVYGGVTQDTIQINENTFWSGSPYNNYNPNAKAHLTETRKHINQGNYEVAQKLKDLNMTIKEQDDGTYANMFDAHPPFQIDGNFGCTAGIAEMLVQSRDRVIHLLPALLDVWKESNVKGLKTRGGFEIMDMKWDGNTLVSVTVKSNLGGNLCLRTTTPLKNADGTNLTLASGANPNTFNSIYTIPAPVIKDPFKIPALTLPAVIEYDIHT